MSFIWGSEETQFFLELTPEKILSAVEQVGVRCTGRVLQLNSMENRVYDLEIEVDGDVRSPSERFRVVKFYRPGRWSKQQILEEHEFLLDLVEYELPVIAPLKFANGETLQRVPGLDIWFTVFPKAGDRNPSELNGDELSLVGRLLARVHNVGATKNAEHRVKLTPQTFGLDNLDYLYDCEIIPEVIENHYCDLVETICGISEELFEKVPLHRIHGDCHLGNIVWGEEGAKLVDFDDMLVGPAVQDLWLLVGGRDEFAKEKMKWILGAYTQMREFDYGSLRLIEALRAFRMVHFSAWIARRYEDESFKRAFPEFGTDKYWFEQVQALEEQVEFLQGPDFW